jgi:hypothetical protein
MPRSFMAYAYLLKLQYLQNNVLHPAGKFPKCTPVCDLHMAFKLPYYMIIKQHCASKEQKSYKIMRMNMLAA